MTLPGLLVFAFALAVAAGPPGPSVAALVSRVITRGVRDALPFMLAIWFGELLWLTAAVAGLAAVAKSYGFLFVALKYAGVAYLLYLALSMWFAPTAVTRDAATIGRRPWQMFAAGLMVALGNSSNLIFYMALLPTLVDLDRLGVLGWAELCGTALLVLTIIDTSWAFAASRARTLLSSHRAMRIANRAGASMMAGAALAIATR